MDNLIIIIIALVVFIWLLYSNRENLYGDIYGNTQKWMQLPREGLLCDSDYNDDQCKFVALNCAGNQGSLFADDRF